jgi:DMSO/TMAO reductase YedYZ molybdopterin-dependent catalytic subunit
VAESRATEHAADDLTYISREPLNAETRLERQAGTITPARGHYVRNHFAIPTPSAELLVDGAVRTALRLTLADLRAMPARSLVVTLECAGNGRAFLEPQAPGEQWRLGAVGTAEWTGVPLRHVLASASPAPNAVEVLFVGADRGTPKDLGRAISYERSLPLADAMRDEVLLAYGMNGEPIPAEHGAPLRLVVPGWYGMASVKWLARMTLIDHAFDGFYQKDRYVIDGRPLRAIAPRAVITSPSDGARVPRAPFVARGRAWTGRSAIDRVEVSSDGGYSWHPASLEAAVSPYAWRGWSISIDPGERAELDVLAYASTAEGEQQPTIQKWTPLGYANNAARPVRVTVA